MKPSVVIFYKTSSSSNNPYHAGGLASNGLHTVAVLKHMGFNAHLQQVRDYADLAQYMRRHNGTTHAIIEAVWIEPEQALDLARRHHDTKVIVRAHSKIGFLQVEPEAIPKIRAIIDASRHQRNLHFSSNNAEFAAAIDQVYGPCLYLPNLYDLAGAPQRRPTDGPLRIASFGATRLLKLHPSAALAALQAAKRMELDLEFFINVDKTPGGDSVRRTIRNLFAGLSWAKLVEVTWQDAQAFKETIASMDLVLQASATETFCMVAADAVASGVPVVTGPAITWVPSRYQAPIDDTSALAAAAVDALDNEAKAARVELKALQAYVKEAQAAWSEFLEPKQRRSFWR